MDGGTSFHSDDHDLIGSATSGEDVISALAWHGCSDLTDDINLEACSNLPLAGGGFCDVYRGRLNDGGYIAIKSLRLYDRPGKDNEKEKTLKRAARELYHWSKLKHPNILPLMGLAMFRGHLSMVSEWMENGSLMAYISLNPNADRVGLCVDICAGLSHIHANDMVHGDIKAANIMVSCSGIAMIADFGNSQLKDLALRFTNTTTSSLSVRWAAPELLLGEGNDSQISKESDVYAYGMTVLETMTGDVPFKEFNEQKVLALVALRSQTPARPETSICNDTWDILQRCWARERSARPDIRTIEKQMRDIYIQSWMRVKGQGNSRTGYLKACTRQSLIMRMTELTTPYARPRETRRSEPSPRDYKKKLHSVSNRAVKYARKGQLAEAESLEAEVVAVQKRVLGEDHPHTLQSMNNLAAMYVQQGRLEEAASLGVTVLAARKRVLGEDHPDTLQTMKNLALTYEKQGLLVEAGLLGAQVVAVRTRVLGEDHPSTLSSMSDLALTYDMQGRLAEAEPLGVAVLAARKRVLGEPHPDTLQSMHNLAAIYGNQGRLAEAESLAVEVVDIMKRVLGEDHLDTLQSMNLARTYKKQDRLAEAESLGTKVLVARERVLGKHHPDSVTTRRWLKRIYRVQGRRAEFDSLIAPLDSLEVTVDQE